MMGVEKRSFAYHLDLVIRFIRRTCLYRWQEYLSSYLLAELRTFWAMNVCERHSTESATVGTGDDIGPLAIFTG